MSKSVTSPTSRLLQSSRLFSLPRPLPQPALDTATSTGVYRASDSATLPYPTHQTIATPASSHFRGDWGLKRPLPAKATRSTSTPHIRVRQQDNAAHITDFGSAADHSQTLVKWQQMGVPFFVHKKKDGSYTQSTRPNQSVYDEEVDNTDSRQARRWKYAGPWLTGMQPGEFELWIMARITKRKDEFRDYLKERMVRKRTQEEQQKLLRLGEGRAVSELRRVQLRKEIDDNFEAEEKRMRDDHVRTRLSSELTAAICEFLDLPGVREAAAASNSSMLTEGMRDLQVAYSPERGPPSTHPAAGLSHLRSNAFLENHPLWGPQLHTTPVLSRVVRPRNSAQGVETHAKLGVGGVVTDDPSPGAFKDLSSPNFPEPVSEVYKDVNRMLNAIEPDLEGGNKVWMHPENAHIDEKGHIRLHVYRGDQEAIAVAENNVEHIHQARNASSRDDYMLPPPGTAGNANYGSAIGLHRPAAPPRPTTLGFDDELAQMRSRGQTSSSMSREQEQLARIRDLARQDFRGPSSR